MVILDIQIELFMSNFFPEVQASDYLKSGNSDSAGTKSSNIEWGPPDVSTFNLATFDIYIYIFDNIFDIFEQRGSNKKKKKSSNIEWGPPDASTFNLATWS